MIASLDLFGNRLLLLRLAAECLIIIIMVIVKAMNIRTESEFRSQSFFIVWPYILVSAGEVFHRKCEAALVHCTVLCELQELNFYDFSLTARCLSLR